MEWFKGRLYVGTVRDILWLFAKVGGHPYLDPYPVPLSPLAEMDLRAQIWSYAPENASWTKVYTSPLIRLSLRRAVEARRASPFTDRRMRILNAPRLLRRLTRPDGRHRARVIAREVFRLGFEWARAGFKLELPRDAGYRNMMVYTDEHGTEALYVVGVGPGRCLLRTTDGASFEGISAFSFRPLVSLKGRVYGSPMGPNTSHYPVVLGTDKPAGEATGAATWRPVSAPGLGDPDNAGIFEMAVFKNHLYAGTGNAKGFQIWKTDATGSPPYRWQRVVTGGGYKDVAGPRTVFSMYPFGEWLYVGGGGALSTLDVFEPSAGELIRIAPDDTWEVVAGNPRETHQGFKAPISGVPAGFGNPLAMYVWRIEEHDGWLYAGINDATTFLRYTPANRVGPKAARWVEQHGGVDKTLEAEAGFDLWRTQDGIHWTCITRTGFGSPLHHGARTLKSTPAGLFVGTAVNFFTDTVDPMTGKLGGGTDIWLGSA
jgi:hypothetical protein